MNFSDILLHIVIFFVLAICLLTLTEHKTPAPKQVYFDAKNHRVILDYHPEDWHNATNNLKGHTL